MAGVPEMPNSGFERCNLKPRAKVTRTNLQRPRQVGLGRRVILIQAQQKTHAQVGVEIIWIDFQLLLKCLSRALLISRSQQRESIIGVNIGKIRIQFYGAFQIGQRAGVVICAEFRGAHQQARLGGIAMLEDLVDNQLSFACLAVADQRRSQHIGNCQTVGIAAPERLQ
jgi:hypothetical protein